MELGERLIAKGLATSADIEAALARQTTDGGRLGDNLIALGVVTADQIAAVVNSAPAIPATLEDTGVSDRNLLNLMIKFMHAEAAETVLDLANFMKLPRLLVQKLVEEALRQRFIGATGATSDLALSTHYSLTEGGRNAVREALEQNVYMGPAPVSLAAYREQIEKQRITNEVMDEATLRGGFTGLVVPDQMFRRLLPAINAGRSVLLYGPPGNGKTTLSTRIAGLFKDPVYIPYAFEVSGQIIKVFDARIHQPMTQAEITHGPPAGLGLH